jgi:hypothetical protein
MLKFSVELFDLLEQRVQILTADKQAKRIQEEIRRKRQEAEAIVMHYCKTISFINYFVLSSHQLSKTI